MLPAAAGPGGTAGDVAERFEQTPPLGGKGRLGGCGLAFIAPATISRRGGRAHFLRLCRIFCRQIVVLRGIFRKIVKFWARSVDVLVGAHAEPPQRRPMKGIPWIDAFAHHRPVVLFAGARPGQQAGARELRRRGQLEEIQNRRGYVHQPARLRGAFGIACGSSRPVDDQRRPQGALVDEIPVAGLAVVAQAFAVIGEQHHQRTLPPSARHQSLLQLADQVVQVFDLRIVAGGVRQTRTRRRVAVRRMQIKEMQEGENRLVMVLAEPLARGPDHQGPIAAGTSGKYVVRTIRGRAEGAVIEIEALVEAQPPVEEHAAYEGRRPVAVTAQHGRQRHCARGRPSVVLLDVVGEGVCGGE